MTDTNATVWKDHHGLLIPDDVTPYTHEELDERLVINAHDPYAMDDATYRATLEQWMRELARTRSWWS